MGRRASEHQAAVTQVLDALTRLESPWTVLRQPRFGLERPDAVVTHPDHGICVIVVSSLRPGSVARNGDGRLLSPEHQSYLADQPHLNAARMADVIYDGYYAEIDDPADRTDAVRSLLVAPFFDDADARATFAQRGEADVQVARTVWGAGFVSLVENAVKGVGGPSAAPAFAVSPAGLGRVVAGCFAAPAPQPLGVPARINPVARMLVDDPTGARCRRVRGPGGSGKTFVLTARAAALAAANKRVCVLSFTTTLEERLRDLVRDRCAELGADPRLVTVSSFHELAEHTVLMAEAAGYESVWPKGARWPQAILDRARQVIEQGFDYRYDAVLVDEGQDFHREWWSMLQTNYLKPDGEMMLAIDPEQDLYNVEPWFDDETLASLGFAEPWVELEGSVRTPDDVRPALPVIVGHDVVDASVTRGELVGPPVRSVRRWVDAERVADMGRQIGREVVRLVRDHPTLTPNDIVFLCDYHHDGLAAVREIERAGIPVHHQFSRDPAGRGLRRRRFSTSVDAVKGATIHGFKGRETGALVMGVGADVTSTALASIAVQRLANVAPGESAVITVVNGDPARRATGVELGWTDDDAVVRPRSMQPASPPAVTAPPVAAPSATAAPAPPPGTVAPTPITSVPPAPAITAPPAPAAAVSTPVTNVPPPPAALLPPAPDLVPPPLGVVPVAGVSSPSAQPPPPPPPPPPEGAVPAAPAMAPAAAPAVPMPPPPG